MSSPPVFYHDSSECAPHGSSTTAGFARTFPRYSAHLGLSGRKHQEEPDANSQETKHVKIGHVTIDRAHFRVHFREHWKISREHWKISSVHSRGSLRGHPLVRFTQKKPQPSWAFPWTSSCTLSWAFLWVNFRGSRALCFSELNKTTDNYIFQKFIRIRDRSAKNM